MSKYKSEFRKLLENDIGSYIPNKVDLDNLVSYLYKAFVNIIRDSISSEELLKVTSPNEIDRQAFMKAIKTVSLSASREVLIDTINETFNNIKNAVPQSTVSINTVHEQPIIGYKSNVNTKLDKAPEAEFSINMSDLGPEFIEAHENASHQIEDINKEQGLGQDLSWDTSEHEFDLDSSFIDRINHKSVDALQQANGIAKSVKSQEDQFIVTSSISKPFNSDDSDSDSDISDDEMDSMMVKDAGLLSSGVFKKEIKVSTDLDY